MSDKVTVNNNSIGFTGLLTIVFVILKATGYINWSWWWVFSPLWIGLLLFFGIFALIAVGAGLALGVAALYDSYRNHKQKKHVESIKKQHGIM